MILQAIATDTTDTFKVNSRVAAYNAVAAIRRDYPPATKFMLDGKEIFVSTGEVTVQESRLEKLWNNSKPKPIQASFTPEERIKKLRELINKRGLDVEIKN